MGANVAYVRVSSLDQNEQRQIESLKQFNIDKWFIEKISGKDINRPELQKMINYVREDDTVFIHDFSRLARSTKDLLYIVDTFKNLGVHLVSYKEKIDTSTATGKLMLTMIAAINEFERVNLLERQREGIAIAKSNGVYKGRKPIVINNFDKYYDKYIKREIKSKSELANILNISRPTLDRLINDFLKNDK